MQNSAEDYERLRIFGAKHLCPPARFISVVAVDTIGTNSETSLSALGAWNKCRKFSVAVCTCPRWIPNGVRSIVVAIGGIYTLGSPMSRNAINAITLSRGHIMQLSRPSVDFRTLTRLAPIPIDLI